MPKRYLIIHIDGILQVFEADDTTERDKFLACIMFHNNKQNHTLSAIDQEMVSDIVDGRIGKAFAGEGIRAKTIGIVTTYFGFGSDGINLTI